MLPEVSGIVPALTNSLSSVAVTRESHIFKKADFVRIINDQSRIKRLQRGHGEWADVMAKSLNKIGKIVDIYHDDDLKVLINGILYTILYTLDFIVNFRLFLDVQSSGCAFCVQFHHIVYDTR